MAFNGIFIACMTMSLLLAAESHPAKQGTAGEQQQAKQEAPQQGNPQQQQDLSKPSKQQDLSKPSKQEDQQQSGKHRELEQPGKVQPQASKDGNGRLFFTGAGSNQVVVGNAGYILVGLISLFALIAIIAAAFTGRRRLDRFRYPAPTSYDGVASHEESSYEVHRSLDEAAKKFQ